eukprot:CAMPEP_0174380760 /NCGR_PEP_ID=MMETSP0811_2-20130205/123577_1 /TAXON_ID=73025 ORGANISM="Eutreptiella gymnastica-like, Strain CCMP1594" /NCGR_SAMPLE_ID=MMETSP0811_2 /ASSEMBLY_ACC=CAM_ASM_000667 /LENGTH=73 /DNA_ID=CAMNT_0015533713 /DNA_START=642 /DNA_END=863 /DNA_ORIENTATION=-
MSEPADASDKSRGIPLCCQKWDSPQPSLASCGIPLRDPLDPCEAGHKMETVHDSGPSKCALWMRHRLGAAVRD